MGIYINCDIYIKKNSDIFSVDDNPLLKSILNLTDDVASVISEEEEIKRLNDMKASLLDDMRKREGENDYSKCDKFYRLVTNGDEVVLMSLGNNFMDTIIRYSNFDDMLNDFEIRTGIFFGSIEIDTVKEHFIIDGLSKKSLEEVEDAISKYLINEKIKILKNKKETD